jgi:hypothetical protein
MKINVDANVSIIIKKGVEDEYAKAKMELT